MKKTEIVVTAHLRQNSRMTLTSLSRKTGICVSTLYDRVKEPGSLGIKRYSVLLDFPSLGFSTQATLLLKAAQDKRDLLKDFLLGSASVNSLMRINNGYDFMAECVFRDLRALEEFCEQVERKYGVKSREVHCVTEELKRESFLAEPALLEVLQ